MEERRLLIAVVLSIAILLGTQYAMRKLYPPQPAPEAKPVAAKPAPPPLPPPAPAPMDNVKTAGTRRTVVIENALYRAAVDTQGGVLRSFRLKKFMSKSHEPLELVPQKIPPQGLPYLALEVPGSPSLTQRLSNAVYELRVGNLPAQQSSFMPPIELLFAYSDGGIAVEKKMAFEPNLYAIEVSGRLWIAGQPRALAVSVGPDIGTEAGEPETDFEVREVIVSHGGRVERSGFAKGKNHNYSEPVDWAGFDTKYFAVLGVSAEAFPSLRMQRFDIRQGGGLFVPYYQIFYPLGAKPVRFFLGPKDYELLNGVAPGLSSVIDYGWFALLVKPLIFSLKLIHQYVQNWGFAIILLTLIISLALFPVRYKQMVSMKKMQAIQPQMRSIQDRYKKYKRTDPKRQEMNAEIMNLYKQNGINPLGGCLPLLIQMPFLFAFNSMLASTIELRGAPFILWIRDLSRMDPYYVTPVLMGVTMYLQQRMTPQTTTDPAQARMMNMMPFIFVFMFFKFPSGLVIYFLFSNLFGMALQKAAEKWMPVPAPSPKPGRRGGKTDKE
ncbi:MAG TPA: membrane protein insertase YidC [Acidobacteriota bacterium]|jgi:YidC/Oxa1 family membrane protein insertase